MALPSDAVDALLERLEARDRHGAAALVHSWRAAGASSSELIDGALAPVQRLVGELWQVDAWDVAQEHVATGIVDAILAGLELEAKVIAARGDVVITCAEGEWHALPARMLAEQLRDRGWAVTFLGASVPANDLHRFVRAARPVAVALSCSMPNHLGGAVRSVEAAHRAGAPVLAGGSAFGADSRRAEAVGADAWTPTAAAAEAVLSAWATQAPALAVATVPGTDLALDAVRGDVVDEALAELAPRHDGALRLRSDLDAVIEFTVAALLTGDPSVLHDHVAWLDGVLRARGAPPELVDTALGALAEAVPAGLGDARTLLAAARARLQR